MCGRYNVETEADDIEMRAILDELNRRYSDAVESLAVKTGEVFPTNVAPVLMQDGGWVRADAMRWGFPKWQGSGVIINARAESVREKRMFSQAVQQRRIAIPTSGFYEWRHEGGKSKEKYLFRRDNADEQILYLAAIYSIFQVEGKEDRRFNILTTAANASMIDYHNRMPVLLEKDETEAWILDEGATDDILHRVPGALKAMPADEQRQMSLLD